MYRVIKEALEKIPALAPIETPSGTKSRVIPLSSLVSELDTPFVIVDSLGAEDEKALNGEVMWTDERFELAVEAETIDECLSLCEQIQAALEDVEGATIGGKYVLACDFSRTKNDGLNEATLLMTRPLNVTIRWWYDTADE